MKICNGESNQGYLALAQVTPGTVVKLFHWEPLFMRTDARIAADGWAEVVCLTGSKAGFKFRFRAYMPHSVTAVYPDACLTPGDPK